MGDHGQRGGTGSHTVAARGGGHLSVPSPYTCVNLGGRRGATPRETTVYSTPGMRAEVRDANTKK